MVLFLGELLQFSDGTIKIPVLRAKNLVLFSLVPMFLLEIVIHEVQFSD
jgi:hypothetical protein